MFSGGRGCTVVAEVREPHVWIVADPVRRASSDTAAHQGSSAQVRHNPALCVPQYDYAYSGFSGAISELVKD